MNAAFAFLGRHLATYLSKPLDGDAPVATSNPAALAMALRQGDVLLVEGNSRISTAIKYLTQSTWSHAALYTGPLPGRASETGEPHVLIEADVVKGVISAPLSKYTMSHTRICRPVGISEAEAQALTAFALARIGVQYDIRNVVDLARYLMPTPPVPSRMRRRMIALGSGKPTQAICSTLIAQAFDAIHYPVLPIIEWVKSAPAGMEAEPIPEKMMADLDREILHIRHYSLYTPRDFDISPFFAIVKPTLESGFDYRRLVWAPPETAGDATG